MSSKGHDFLVEIIHMKMKQLEFRIVLSESHYHNERYQIPPTIIHHRPDVIGISKDDSSICIGEAKYFGDMVSERSWNQIIDFIELTSDPKYTFIVSFPESEEDNFNKIIKSKNLELNNSCIVLSIPDRLIPRADEKDEAL